MSVESELTLLVHDFVEETVSLHYDDAAHEEWDLDERMKEAKFAIERYILNLDKNISSEFLSRLVTKRSLMLKYAAGYMKDVLDPYIRLSSKYWLEYTHVVLDGKLCKLLERIHKESNAS